MLRNADWRDYSHTDLVDLVNYMAADIEALDRALKEGADEKTIYEKRLRVALTMGDDETFGQWLAENPKPA